MIPKNGIYKVVPWLVILAVGSAAGAWLGNIIIADLHPFTSIQYAPYADLSGNPDAVAVDSITAGSCEDCADHYGGYGGVIAASARASADREEEYRALGYVDTQHDWPVPFTDDYQYGGRYPDPPSASSGSGMRDRSISLPSPITGKDISPTTQPKHTEKAPDATPLDRKTTPLIY